MSSRIRVEARRQSRALLKSIEDQIAAGKQVDLALFNEQFEMLSSIENMRTPKERILGSAIPLIIALLLLGPLWLIRKENPSIRFTAEVTRLAVLLETDETLDLGSFGKLSELHVEGLDKLSSSMGEIDFNEGKGTGTLFIDRTSYLKQITLSPIRENHKLKNNSKSWFAISKHARRGQLEINNFNVFARVIIDESANINSGTTGQMTKASVSEGIIDFHGPDTSQASVGLFFELGESAIELPVVSPGGIFLQDKAFDTKGTPITFSSLKQGSLVFTNTDRVHEFLHGTSLILQKLDGDLRIKLGPDALEITYEGKAGVVGLSSNNENLVHDLRPSLAEWICNDRVLALMWSSLLFTLSLILTLRNSLRN